MNIIEDVKIRISEKIAAAYLAAAKNGELLESKEDIRTLVKLEVPKEKAHGDFATNISMLLAKELKMPPRKIAEAILSHIEKDKLIEKAEVAGAGFINFYLANSYLYPVLKYIEEMGTDYGRIDLGKGKKVMVEFVSANPTGPMHLGNARGGALGDCLASVLEYAGFDVTREFYINDAGNQIEKFGKSLEARYIQLIKGEDAFEFPEDGYHGEDITEHMKKYIELHGDKLLNVSSEERKEALVSYALEKNIASLKADLEKYRIYYDVWFRESSLHKSGAVNDVINKLTESGYTYEKEDALWLNCIKMGLEKDEVLVRSNGIPTYFAADIAYHANKLRDRGFDLAIDVWGADHHGHVARMKGAMAALGIDPLRLEIVIMQLVRLVRGGETVRMSKRTGKAVTLNDLLDECSTDVARFFFNMRTAGSHLDFDLELAAREDSENPVFYVQYAHARICSILRVLDEDGIKVKAFSEINPSLLTEESEITLLKKLAELPEEIKSAALLREPARITRYVIDLATDFHSFYNSCRVKGCGEELTAARLKLIESVKIVIEGVLSMLKISAPEKM